MMNENEDIPYIQFDAPLHCKLDIPIPHWLEEERRNVDVPDIVSVNNLNSSASFDGSTASPTSAYDATESSTTTASSDAFPNDSNSSASFDGSTASPTSASDATESSTTTASSETSPNDSIPNSSTSNEPEEKTFPYYGRKMTFEQIQNLSNNPKLRALFEKSSKIYYEMKHSPSSMYFFFEDERKQCRKVPVPELNDERTLFYEPIVAFLRSQNLFEDKLVLNHFKDPIYIKFINWFFEVFGFVGMPPLLLGKVTDLSLADFIVIVRLTFGITKVQHYLKHHTFVEAMKMAESLASTGANAAWIAQDSDPFGKDGGFASLFTDKILESDPGLKELVDLYYKIVEIYQKYAVPISIRIIKNMIQKNKVIENKEKKETENLGDKGVKYCMIDAHSSKFLKFFPDCCKQVSAMFMHSFKNGNTDMKTILSYHFSVQNNGHDGKADGLMTLGLFHRALFVLVSLLSIFHNQDFKDIFEKREFDLKMLLKAAGVAGVKESKCALVSKSTNIFCRSVGSNTIESCSLENFVREKGISYEDFLSPFANPFTYKRNVQELRGYDVSLDRSSLTQYNTFRGVSGMKSGKFKCEFYLQEKKFRLGFHHSAVIAAYVHDQALKLSGIRDVTLNFESDEDYEEKLQVAIDAELIKKQETMSEEEKAKFDQESYIAECKESIPSDAVIKGVVVDGIAWADSLKGINVVTKKVQKLIGVHEVRQKFEVRFGHNKKNYYLGTHQLEIIAGRVYDKAAILLGRENLNFESDEDYEEKLQVAIDAELIKKQETMSEEEKAKFDQESYIAECKESIPSDAVIKGAIEYDLTWKESVKRNGVLEYVDEKGRLCTVTIKNNVHVERSEQGKESEANVSVPFVGKKRAISTMATDLSEGTEESKKKKII